MQHPKRPTLNHVAQLSGVSQTSVSMILNNRTDVTFSEETIRRVHDAARELGYSKIAEKNRARRIFDKRMVIVITPTLTNPYYATIVQAIDQAARAKKYTTMVYTTYRDAENERYMMNILRNIDVAGVIFTSTPVTTEPAEVFSKSVPVVVIGDRNTSVNMDTVEISNYKAGTLIARHMLDLGHRHIAYISTTLSDRISARVRRLQGLQDTYARECPEGTVLVKSMEITPEKEMGNLQLEQTVGETLAKECLEDRNITAFVAVNDMVAYGVISMLHANGYSVPRDYSVCGFDNIFPSQFAGVSLTTVEHHIDAKGHNAFEILLNKINQSAAGNGQAKSITHVEYQHHLIVRNSTAAPRVR